MKILLLVLSFSSLEEVEREFAHPERGWAPDFRVEPWRYHRTGRGSACSRDQVGPRRVIRRFLRLCSKMVGPGLVIVTLVACLVPATRVLETDPATISRSE